MQLFRRKGWCTYSGQWAFTLKFRYFSFLFPWRIGSLPVAYIIYLPSPPYSLIHFSREGFSLKLSCVFTFFIYCNMLLSYLLFCSWYAILQSCSAEIILPFLVKHPLTNIHSNCYVQLESFTGLVAFASVTTVCTLYFVVRICDILKPTSLCFNVISSEILALREFIHHIQVPILRSSFSQYPGSNRGLIEALKRQTSTMVPQRTTECGEHVSFFRPSLFPIII